jgi:hypothetical protein
MKGPLFQTSLMPAKFAGRNESIGFYGSGLGSVFNDALSCILAVFGSPARSSPPDLIYFRSLMLAG